MPSTNVTYENIQITNKNIQDENAEIDARVIANYGDPGLTEDYQFDLLSRYVICAIESSNRVVTANKFNSLIVLVQRPKELWINYAGGIASSPSLQQRSDFFGNINVGSSSAFSSNNIAPINNPYQLGELIKIKLIKNKIFPAILEGDSLFLSSDSRWTSVQQSYMAGQNQGAGNTYIQNLGGITALMKKTITPLPTNNTFNINSNYFYICLSKIQYEAFALYQYPDQQNNLINLFSNPSSQGLFGSLNGGYIYNTSNGNFQVNFAQTTYIDMNHGLKARTSVQSCIPSIVLTPNTLTLPSVRNSGTTSYQPVYITQQT